MNMNKTKDDVTIRLIFNYKNYFQDNTVSIRPKKLTLKTKNAQFLTAFHQVFLQDIKKYFLGFRRMQNTIEFQLTHYEIPQLSPY